MVALNSSVDTEKQCAVFGMLVVIALLLFLILPKLIQLFLIPLILPPEVVKLLDEMDETTFRK